MSSVDLSELRRLYRDGVNVIDHLKRVLGTKQNTDQLVETAYDLQAGTYIAYVEKYLALESVYQNDVVKVLHEIIGAGDSVVDVGTGEMTTLTPVAAACYRNASRAYAIDISLSRLLVGLKYLDGKLPVDSRGRIEAAAATLFRLPFANDSVDVVWTSHALEPNGGKEFEAIAELARVCRKYLVLFEPSYERNSANGKERMQRLGYVKNLEGTIREIPGLRLESVQKMARPDDDPNPTYAHIVRKINPATAGQAGWCCPLAHRSMETRGGYLFSPHSLLAYPIIEGIPILRVEKGINASVLDVDGGVVTKV